MSIRIVISFLVWVLAGSCFEKSSLPIDSEIFFPAKRLGQLKDKKLEEASGLASSAANPGFLWTHNDSGNPAAVYLVDEDLKIRLTCKLMGIKNRDWEDIAVGPGPDENKRYLYVADIGDNEAKHAEKYIYRFEEPRLGDQSGEITISAFDTISFRLEDGKKDTEAIMIHPVTKDIYVVTKREAPVHVYELKYPYSLGEASIAQEIVSLPFTQIVSAGISMDGEEMVMKNYDHIFYWDIKGKSIGEVLKQEPKILKYTEEPQGEAIAFKTDGSGFYTLSEKIKGHETFLYFYGKQKR